MQRKAWEKYLAEPSFVTLGSTALGESRHPGTRPSQLERPKLERNQRKFCICFFFFFFGSSRDSASRDRVEEEIKVTAASAVHGLVCVLGR
jgi:hypothetical protein